MILKSKILKASKLNEIDIIEIETSGIQIKGEINPSQNHYWINEDDLKLLTLLKRVCQK